MKPRVAALFVPHSGMSSSVVRGRDNRTTRELGAQRLDVEAAADESTEERFHPEVHQQLVADGVDRGVGDRVAVEASRS